MLATPASAQDIGYKMDKIAKGSSVTIKRSNGDVRTHKILGKIGNDYVYETYAGPKGDGALVDTIFTNEHGEFRKAVKANGDTTLFEPHNCFRTLGTCSFVQTDPDGSTKTRSRLTEVIASGLRFTVRDENGDILYTGTGEMDEYGWPTKTFIKITKGNQTRRTNMVSADYR